MDQMMTDVSGVNEVGHFQNNNIPAQILSQILSRLPQKYLVLCREVCPYWRIIIDLHCPMKEIIILKQNDKFLDRKLELRMTSCVLYFFHKDNPNIMILTHPQTIKSFIFCDRHRDYNENDLNVQNAYGLLSQIKPFVEILKFETGYYNTNVLFPPYRFPKVRELYISLDDFSHAMNDNLQTLFSHQFPSLEKFHLEINYLTEKLTDEAYSNFFIFLANHRQTVKKLVTLLHYGSKYQDHELPEPSQPFVLSKEVKGILSNGQLGLESLELLLPPKYVPSWAPIIESQKKLIDFTVHYKCARLGPGGIPFYAIAPGISSCISTLRTVSLSTISSVESDGRTWIPLDLSLFRDAVNLTELYLQRNYCQRHHVQTPLPIGDEAWIKNLHVIYSASLKSLKIDSFICNSGELQILVDNAPVLETLYLSCILASRISDRFSDTGIHGGIVKSFMEKESKKDIRVIRSVNYEHREHNEKLRTMKILYPPGQFIKDTKFFFRRSFPLN